MFSTSDISTSGRHSIVNNFRVGIFQINLVINMHCTFFFLFATHKVNIGGVQNTLAANMTSMKQKSDLCKFSNDESF